MKKFKKCCENCVGRRMSCWIYDSKVETNCQWNKDENFCNKYLKDLSLVKKNRNIQKQKIISMIIDEASFLNVEGKVDFEKFKKSCIKLLD